MDTLLRIGEGYSFLIPILLIVAIFYLTRSYDKDSKKNKRNDIHYRDDTMAHFLEKSEDKQGVVRSFFPSKPPSGK